MSKLAACLALVLGLGISTALSAQSVVRGVVVDQNKQPIIGASASLKHTHRHVSGASTDAGGHFVLQCRESGTCDLSVSYLGHETYHIRLSLKDKDILQLDTIVLPEISEALLGIEIVGRQRRDYNSDYSYASTKMPIRNRELPLSVSTVTKELIQDRAAYQLAEAVKGTSSVQQTGPYNHFNIRGITQNQSGQVVNGMRTNQIYFLQPLTQNVERIEVLKGPGSITLSSADPGGTINLVTKKPLKETRREVQLALGSFSTVRGGVDFTGPLNQDKTLLYRLNVGMQKAKSYRDNVDNSGMLISPSVSYIPSERTAINLELIYSDNHGTLDRGHPSLRNAVTKEDLLQTPASLRIGGISDYYHTQDFLATISLSQKLSNALLLNVQYMKELWNEDLKEHRVDGSAYVKTRTGEQMPNLIPIRYSERLQKWTTDALNLYLTYSWALGASKQTLLVGYDMNSFSKTKGGANTFAPRRQVKDASGAIVYETYTHPLTGAQYEVEKWQLGYFDIYSDRNEYRNTNSYNLTAYAIPPLNITTHAAYVQNLSKFGGLNVLLSLRKEWINERHNQGWRNEEQVSHSALLPRIGLSYNISKTLSAYATWLKGFQPQSNSDLMPVIGNYEPPVAAFKPLESSLLEAGLKGEFFGGRLKATASVFQIEQKNIVMRDPQDPDQWVQRGSDRSRGLELELAGYLSPELQISAAYGYIDAIITHDSDPTLIGARKEATPKHNASLWAKYSFAPSTALRGLSLGLGVQHSSDRLGWYDRTLTLPAYTVADAVLSYRPVGMNVDFSLKVNNLLDTRYWTGAIYRSWLFPGAPRSVMLSTSYRF